MIKDTGQGCQLAGADLKGLNLTDADLRYANLVAARLAGADFQDVNFLNAKLIGADLRYANLVGATNLESAYLDGCKYNAASVFPDDFNPHSHYMYNVIRRSTDRPRE